MSDNFFASIIEAVNQLNSRNGEVFLGIGQNLFQQIAIGMLVLHEPRSAGRILGITLVVAGVVALNLGGVG